MHMVTAWDIFYSQWVETIRFDEGEEAAQEVRRSGFYHISYHVGLS